MLVRLIHPLKELARPNMYNANQGPELLLRKALEAKNSSAEHLCMKVGGYLLRELG